MLENNLKEKTQYNRIVNKDNIPTCNILGVNIAAIDMEWLLRYIDDNLQLIKGDYICVSNVHTTVTSYKDKNYKAIQNNALMAIPDGGPLSTLAHKRGYRGMKRTAGPSLMGDIFKDSYEKGYRHFFYGSTEQTLNDMVKNIEEEYPGIIVAGTYSPPFRQLTDEEDIDIVRIINNTKPDFAWVGLGAPKQEIWMANHQGMINGLMIGVGAGFDYFAGNIHRAPIWMQNLNLEWLYRLMQDPKRLFKRYLTTNIRYIWDAILLRKYDKNDRIEHKKQTVLLVHNYYKQPGGEDSVVANEKKLLEDHGHKVYLYTRHNDELDSMSKFAVARKTIFNLSTYKEIKSQIKERNIDIVHVHNTLSLISPAVFYAAISRKVPVVQTIHNFRMLCPNALFYRDGHVCEECIQYGLKRSIKYACYRNNVFQTIAMVLNAKIHRFTKIYSKINFICLTEFNKQKLLSLKQIKPEKVFVKPNLPRESIIENNTSVKPQFVYVGRLDQYKGVRILLKAWKLYEAEGGTDRLIICGTGEQDRWCHDYIKANSLKNVQMRGFVPNDKTIEIISESKALILPTQLYEGFPMTIVEAYSVGTPVIASNIGNAGDLVEEDITGWKFQFDREESLVEVVKRCQNMKIDRELIRKKYRDDYVSSVNYQVLSNIYNKIQ